MSITDAKTQEQQMFYELEGVVVNGGHFVLWKEPHHTTEDLKTARRYVRSEQDVVTLRTEKITDKVWERIDRIGRKFSVI